MNLSRPGHRGLVALAICLVASIAAPLVAPFSHSRQFDPAAGRHLPPGSRRYLIELVNGRELLAEQVLWSPRGVRILRLSRLTSYLPEEVRSLPQSTRQVLFPLGTDRLGRDCLSRLLHATRTSLLIALSATVIGAVIGIAIGTVSGFAGTVTDAILTGAIDFALSFPQLFVILVAASIFGTGPMTLVVILGATTWMPLARIVRADIRTARTLPFVTAAIAVGCTRRTVLWRHLLPQALGSASVVTMLSLGDVILLESALSFLGLGISPPTPTWGRMIAGGALQLEQAWWVVIFPGLALVGTVLAINLTGDELLSPGSALPLVADCPPGRSLGRPPGHQRNH
jgi:peptide/nickel transport system permease protein